MMVDGVAALTSITPSQWEKTIIHSRGCESPWDRVLPAGWLRPVIRWWYPMFRLTRQWSVFVRNHPDLNISSIACVPIRSGEKTLGVIQLLNSKLDLLSEYSISFLRILCDYAAIAIGECSLGEPDPPALHHG